MTDDLALDHETVNAQLEVCPETPERLLTCGHTKRTWRTDAATCHHPQCRGIVRVVMTPAHALREAEAAERGAQINEDLARASRARAAILRRYATEQGDST